MIMYKAKCMQCTYEQEADTLEQARTLATLHTRFTPHILCFGDSE